MLAMPSAVTLSPFELVTVTFPSFSMTYTRLSVTAEKSNVEWTTTVAILGGRPKTSIVNATRLVVAVVVTVVVWLPQSFWNL